MTRLKELYRSVETLKREGIELGDLLDRVSEVEQDIQKRDTSCNIRKDRANNRAD